MIALPDLSMDREYENLGTMQMNSAATAPTSVLPGGAKNFEVHRNSR
jgi:hypothetical protein